MDTVESLKRLERETLEAAVNADVVVLDRVLAEDYTLTTPNGAVVSKAEYMAGLQLGLFSYDWMELESVRVRLCGPSAIVTGRARIKGRFAGHETTGTDAYLTVYFYRGDQWQAVETLATRVQDGR